MSNAFLRVENLTVEYHTKSGPFTAVNDVSFEIPKGKTLALVGESGCGKSTVANTIMCLVQPKFGRFLLDDTDLTRLKDRDLRKMRKRFQMVFQDPYGSLDPHLTAEEIITEPLRFNKHLSSAQKTSTAHELLERVGLPESARDRKPHEFSGGQRQRIGIARALASNPQLLVCDEATSALDVSVQAQVLDLLREIQQDTGITYLFISHNLGVSKEISDSIAVMRAGQIVESGDTVDVLTQPKEDYTRRLRRSALDPSTMVGLKPREVVATVSGSV